MKFTKLNTKFNKIFHKKEIGKKRNNKKFYTLLVLLNEKKLRYEKKLKKGLPQEKRLSFESKLKSHQYSYRKI